MIDYFALLAEPRRPWLDPSSLKQKFLTLSAQFHPDRVHNASDAEKRRAQTRYTEINAAYNRLRDPRERLLHLLELERGEKPKQIENIPADLMNMFLEISQLCREADAFLTEKAGVTSPLLQVRIFERAQQLLEKLTASQKEMNSRQEKLITELKDLDEGWSVLRNSDSSSRSALLQKLEKLYRLFSYFTRWSSQLQERIVQLSL